MAITWQPPSGKTAAVTDYGADAILEALLREKCWNTSLTQAAALRKRPFPENTAQAATGML